MSWYEVEPGCFQYGDSPYWALKSKGAWTGRPIWWADGPGWSVMCESKEQAMAKVLDHINKS